MLLENGPPDILYTDAGSFHQSAPGAKCQVLGEIALNRIVRRGLGVPNAGFRSLCVTGEFDLAHLHGLPGRLSGRRLPVVMSEGSSLAVYLQDYLNWSDGRLSIGLRRARHVYRILGLYDRLLNLERVARVFVFSRWARDINIRWGADPTKIDVVYPGFPTPTPVDRCGRTAFTFLFVGTDFERKGGFEVVEAFDAVAARYPEARLVLVSPDPRERNPDRAIHSWVSAAKRERTLARLEALERRGAVERHPLQERHLLYKEIYPLADVFVMPSRAEGFGFTNVEAMSFGLPVISSRVGAIPEVIADGATGILVSAGDVSALSSAMEKVIADRSLARRMGEAARTTFLDRFTLERFRAGVGRIYREAIETRCPGS